ncbi:toprim domain-containing protein, partial [Streptomyces scabiei]
RDTRADIPDNEKKYVKIKQGGQNLFNSEALSDDSKPLFIVEGELDALSIMQVTNKANAVGLGSTTNLKLLKQAIQQNR